MLALSYLLLCFLTYSLFELLLTSTLKLAAESSKNHPSEDNPLSESSNKDLEATNKWLVLLNYL